MDNKKAFTLVELLVVVAIIALLVSILLPALGNARQQARNVVCASQIKQSSMAAFSYATGVSKNDRLPRGATGNGTDESDYFNGNSLSITNTIYEDSFECIARFLEDTRIMVCPNAIKWYENDAEYNGGRPFITAYNKSKSWNAFTLGYNYLGGHYAQNWPDPVDPQAVKWYSPSTLSDRGDLPLFVDLIWQSPYWANFGKGTDIAHAKNGAFRSADGTTSPDELVSKIGGNVGVLDGSVKWKSFDEMEKHHTYNFYRDLSRQMTFGWW